MALSRELIKMRNSGTIEIIRKTLKTRTKRPINAISESSIGIKLTTTIKVSKIFQPLLKNPFLLSEAMNRMVISIKKKMVTAISA